MEHSVRVTFWIVCLSGYLLTESLPLHEVVKDINQLKKVKCPSDSIFYAPANVKAACHTTALDCVFRELNGTVKQECENSTYIDKVLDFLEYKISVQEEEGYAKTNSSDCACEKWPQAPFSEFLDKTESLLEQVNSFRDAKKGQEMTSH